MGGFFGIGKPVRSGEASKATQLAVRIVV